ncbi:MAG: family 78 glycoside hydrolase catalytic domain [Oscillospiraceae bacterium]|nr:family 78 glycoside hydrolase catalytic domain [Oscillospiraceae bacterium]
MNITQIKLNGVRESAGYVLSPLTVSFKVTETESRAPKNLVLTLAEAAAPEAVLAKKEGPGLNMAGETLDVSLKPRTDYLLRIRVEGDAGDGSEAEYRFETGKRGEPWQAKWIAAAEGDGCHPLLRKKLNVGPGLARARLYAAGLGLFEACVNGEKLGDEYLKPGVTNYETRVQTITFPVENLHEGENELSFLLGKGWYMGRFGLENGENNFGDRMAVIGELYLDYADGRTELVCTGEGFEYRPSDIVESGIYFGETIDRRIHESTAWAPAAVIEDPGASPGTKNLDLAHLTDRLSPPLRVIEKLPVREIIITPAGETVLDFGQNFAGFPEFDAALPRDTRVVLDFGEVLQGGNFYRGNYREANSQLVYVSNGEAETVRPSFTFFGFRYVRVTGWVGELKKEMFRGCVLHSDMDRAGSIRTGNAKIDRLYENTLWGLRSNFLDMPTDCPQRNERLGWTGDAQIFAPTASYHMDTKAFFHKFEQDLMDEQAFLNGVVPNYVPNIGHKPDAASAWGDIGTFLPMTLWKYYGDKAELAFAYPMMKGWVDYMDRLDASRGERRYTFEPGFQFGDWLGLDGVSETSFKGGTDDSYLGAVYYYQSARLTAEAAEILGEGADAARYAALAEHIRRGVLNEYFTPSGRFALDTQASYVVALKFGLWVDRDRLIVQFREKLKKGGYRIRCGFVGAPMLCTVLAECGLTELAYDFLLKEGYPSWLYCVNLGATTVWERWNSLGPDGVISPTGMNSLNHYAYGSVMEFVYAWAAGIRPAVPGFRKAVIAPNPDYRLPRLDCAFDSVSGSYVCNTRIHSDGTLSVHVEVPFGCEAELTLPRSEEGTKTLPAGRYDFNYCPTRDYRQIFDETTPISVLGRNEQALGILFGLVPPIGGMAKGNDPEFGSNGLAEFRRLSFLPFEPEKLEEAIRRIRALTVELPED